MKKACSFIQKFSNTFKSLSPVGCSKTASEKNTKIIIFRKLSEIHPYILKPLTLYGEQWETDLLDPLSLLGKTIVIYAFCQWALYLSTENNKLNLYNDLKKLKTW